MATPERLFLRAAIISACSPSFFLAAAWTVETLVWQAVRSPLSSYLEALKGEPQFAPAPAYYSRHAFQFSTSTFLMSCRGPIREHLTGSVSEREPPRTGPLIRSSCQEVFMMRLRSATIKFLFATALAQSVACGCEKAEASEITRDEMLSYLVETICPDGEEVELRVIGAKCSHPRLRRREDRMKTHRHDWPGLEDAVSSPSGYQRSDAYLTFRAGHPIAVHTFDFGTGGRTFGVFDQGKGDGGQIAEIDEASVAFTMTEDGGDGVQWFVGPRCWGDEDTLKSGWLIFTTTLGEEWTQSIVRLQKARHRNDCSIFFSRSLTRWRRLQVDWPFLVNGRQGASHALDTVISEHFGGQDVENSDHLERFFLAKGIGLIRWERWQNWADRSEDFSRQAKKLALSRRCPPVNGSLPPSAGWIMVDCRTWTNLVRAVKNEPASFDWYQGE